MWLIQHTHTHRPSPAFRPCPPLYTGTPPFVFLLQTLQAASGKHKNTLAPERAYCLFRLERHEDALEVARSAGGIGSFDGTRRGKALAHLEAQVVCCRRWWRLLCAIVPGAPSFVERGTGAG